MLSRRGSVGEVTWIGRAAVRLSYSWSVRGRRVGTCEWSRAQSSLVSLWEVSPEVVRRFLLFMYKCSWGGLLKTHVWPRDFCSDFPLASGPTQPAPMYLLSPSIHWPPCSHPPLLSILKAHSSPLGSPHPSLVVLVPLPRCSFLLVCLFVLFFNYSSLIS